MEVGLFGEDALPQALYLFSHLSQKLGAKKEKNVMNTSARSRIARYIPALLNNAHAGVRIRTRPCNHLEYKLQRSCFASVSLDKGPNVLEALDEIVVEPVNEEKQAKEEEDKEGQEEKGVSIVVLKFVPFDKQKIMKEMSVLERAAIGAAAGGIAGAFTYACLHPLDTIKTRLQTRGAAEAYKGSVDTAMKILKTKGIAGFYSGISAVVVGSTISSAIYFGTCEFGKSLLAKVNNFPAILIPPIAGAMGNIVSSAVLVPKEVITQRMQAGAKGRSWNVFVNTLQRDGIKGLYVGYSAALLRNLPSGVISFSTFEYLRGAWLRIGKKETLEPWQSVSSGALAGAIAAGLTTPMDVVKTRLMTQTKSKVAEFTYQGVVNTLRQIWLEEGWAGLTRGVGPRLLHSACFSAIGFFAFETARTEILKRHVANKQRELAVKNMQQL